MPEQLGFEDTTSANQELLKLDELFKAYKWKLKDVRWTDLDNYLLSLGITSQSKRKHLIHNAAEAHIIENVGTKHANCWVYKGISTQQQPDKPQQLPLTMLDESELEY
jgi:hypothetical protein